MSISGLYFQAWQEKLYRRRNVLKQLKQFALSISEYKLVRKVIMKKLLYALCVLIATEIVMSCASTNGEKVKSASDEEFMAKEQTVEESLLEYKRGKNRKEFSLAIDDAKPVISFQCDSGTVALLVDTGAPVSYIKRSGLKILAGKEFYNNEKQIVAEFRNTLIEKNVKDAASLSDDEIKNMLYKRKIDANSISPWLNCTFDNNLYTAKMLLYPDDSETEIDGILGQNFLEQYKNVSFDYKNQYLIFNDNKISEHEIPFYTIHLVGNPVDNYYAVDALIDGEKESCMIDTGCNTFSLRRDFQKDKMKNYDEIFSGKYECVKNVLDTVVLSNVTYKKITALYVAGTGTNFAIPYDEMTNSHEVLNDLIYQTTIGYPFFKGHVIQLDFENHVFRIR
jgi:hypothetical protein